MTSHAPLSRRSDDPTVVIVPGREVSGTPRLWPGPPSRPVDVDPPEPSWPVVDAADERRRGSPLVTFGVTMLVVAATVGLAALAAPGAVRSTIGWASSVLEGKPPARPDQETNPPPATGLDPELARRFEAAQAAAAAEGVDLTVTSGWRTVDQQQALVDQALERYGNAAEAHRWVAPAESSTHVLGQAIDVGPTSGASWLQEHGARFGLCQVFANEVWHFEATVEPGGTCPALVPDASGLWS